MNTNPLLSVIIPVYKVEPYLRACVDSVLNQTYANLEVILIDDGSPDGCPAICDEYAARDTRVRVIHMVNGGVSAARNAGLDLCTGDVIGFVDSDDTVASEMYETLIGAMAEHGADMAVCGLAAVRENGTEVWRQVPRPGVFSGEELFYKCLKQEEACVGQVMNKAFRRTLFTETRFPVEYRLWEDACVMFALNAACKKAVCLDLCCYYYLQRADSCTYSFFHTFTDPREALAFPDFLIRFTETHFPQYRDDAFWSAAVSYYLAISEIRAGFAYGRNRELYRVCLERLRETVREAAPEACSMDARMRRRVRLALDHPCVFGLNRFCAGLKRVAVGVRRRFRRSGRSRT